MYREKIEDLNGLLDRARREATADVGVLSDGAGREVTRAGSDEALPPAARELLSPQSLRRIALALDDEEPEYEPAEGETGGAHVLCSKADRFVMTLVAPGSVPMNALRERRKRFLGHRLLTRVNDKNHFMPAEVRAMLEKLCDGLLDMEAALATGTNPAELVHQFHETLGELVAWPKGGKESFQHNLEILQDSTRDLRPDDLTPERLEAMIGGLQVSIESWLLP